MLELQNCVSNIAVMCIIVRIMYVYFSWIILLNNCTEWVALLITDACTYELKLAESKITI